MRIFRVHKYHSLFGFGDPILDLPILGKSLGEYQKEVCSNFGITIEDVSKFDDIENPKDAIYFESHVVFNKGFLASVLDEVKRNKYSAEIRFGLKKSPCLERFCLPNNLETEEYALPFYIGEISDSCKKVLVGGQEIGFSMPMPRQIVPSGDYHLNMNTVYASEILSPFHLLQANMLLNLNRTLSTQLLLPTFFRERFVKPFGALTRIGLKMMNRYGKGCKIHPSAVVEGCILGDNVVVGANSVLRLSIIGSNTFIGDSAVVNYSVVGENNYVMTGNQLGLCLTYEDVFTIHGPYQFSVFGKSTAVFATINCDIRLDSKTIKIETALGVMDSRQHLLGIAYGHRSKVGASNIIAAGRMVPNDAVLNPPDFIHLKF